MATSGLLRVGEGRTESASSLKITSNNARPKRRRSSRHHCRLRCVVTPKFGSVTGFCQDTVSSKGNKASRCIRKRSSQGTPTRLGGCRMGGGMLSLRCIRVDLQALMQVPLRKSPLTVRNCRVSSVGVDRSGVLRTPRSKQLKTKTSLSTFSIDDYMTLFS